MMRIALVVALVGGCSALATPKEAPRWPDHRKRHDKELADLHVTVETQAAQIKALEARLGKLEAIRPAPASASDVQ